MWTATFLRRNSTSRTALESLPSRTLKYGVSAGVALWWKSYRCFNFPAENLERFRSTELYGAPLEGSTIFLYHSSLGHTALESCQLAELKFAIFSRTRRKTKKLRRSKLFLSTVFRHGLLEGSTFLFQYSYIPHTKLERSRLGELKYAISVGYDVRLKNESLWKGKKWHFTTGAHGHFSMGCLRDQYYYFDTVTQAVHC